MAFVHCTILIVCLGTATCNTLELLREACPYSNFCTTPSIKPFNKTDTIMPCCYDCYCDVHCSAFGDCCPDYKGNEKTSTNLARIDCKPIYMAAEQTKDKLLDLYIGGLEQMEDRYRVIDFCPDGFNEDSTMIDKCTGSFVELPQFADLVVVSDVTGRMFKNKYCAFCHGVRQFISWQMKLVRCVEDISSLQLTLSQARYFMLNKCVMTSEIPRGVHVSPRMLACPMNMVCPDTDRELAEGCANGPYMPYFDMSGRVIVHKNVLCYKYCTGEQERTECQNLEAYKTKVTIASYQVLLNLRQAEDQPLRSGHIKCGEAEILDRHTDECRRLYCPPFDVVAYGHCVQMSTEITNLKLSINIIYTMANTSLHPIINYPERYNETLRRYYLRRIEKRHGYPKCVIQEVDTSIFTDKVIGRFTFLVVNIIYEINQECTIEYIAERIRHSRNSVNTEAWLIQDILLKMGGRISFYNPPVNRMFNAHHYQLLFTKSGNAIRIMPLEHFFLCPYFKLSFDEYSQHLKGRGQYDVGVEKPSPMSIYVDGFYPASENEIIVCVDTYQTGSGSDTARAYLLFQIISVSAFVLLN